MTQIIGVTGGVGCGKSTVLKVMEQRFHCLVLSTDDISRRQMEPGERVYQRVVEAFGDGILRRDGTVDRARLAAEVFSDTKKLAQLNSLTHPAVTEEVLEIVERERARAAQGKAGAYDAVLIETALLIEGGYDAFCDQVWYVYAPEEQRRARLKASRGYTDEKIDDLFARQQTEETYRAVATAVIDNSDGKSEENLIIQLEKLLNENAINEKIQEK